MAGGAGALAEAKIPQVPDRKAEAGRSSSAFADAQQLLARSAAPSRSCVPGKTQPSC